jgi:hypothetical protein
MVDTITADAFNGQIILASSDNITCKFWGHSAINTVPYVIYRDIS